MRNIKVGEADSTLLRAYFDVKLLDGQNPALSEAGGQPEYNINGGSFNPVGIGILVASAYGRYYAVLSSGILTTAGDVIRTRYKSGLTLETFGDTFLVVSSAGTLPDDAISIAFYGTIGDGDEFFNNSLQGKRWKKSSTENKRRALIDATQIIDRLNFAGAKTSSLQVLQFPRANSYTNINTVVTATQDVNVPDDIKTATYLIADKLLDGWDPDIESDLMAVQSSKYQGASTNYNRDYIPEHVRAGIPSARAWKLLRPFVRDPLEVDIVRL